MSKKKNKTKPTPQATPANPYRKIVLILNPLVLVVLAACIYAGLPLEAIVSLGVVGYGDTSSSRPVAWTARTSDTEARTSDAEHAAPAASETIAPKPAANTSHFKSSV